jgi:hypothetical protein
VDGRGQLGPRLRALPLVGAGDERERVERLLQHGDPAFERLLPGQPGQHGRDPLDELREPADPRDVA